jgi:hypothetical protein
MYVCNAITALNFVSKLLVLREETWSKIDWKYIFVSIVKPTWCTFYYIY